MGQIRIGNSYIGTGMPCFLIAEVGINHNGSLAFAEQLIEAAAKAGAQAVKFQKRDVSVVYTNAERQTPRDFPTSFIENALKRAVIEDVSYPVFPERGQLERLEVFVRGEKVPTYNGDLKYALEFGPKEWDVIRQKCEDLGLAWGVSPWDGLSVQEIDGFKPDFHKVASACLTHKDLLIRIRKTGRPVILSTGGSTLEQVRTAVGILGRENLVILHCTATYPCKDEDANIAVLETLQREFPGVPIGYSGHEGDTLASKLSVSMGAAVIERHITLDKEMPGSDQKASIDPTTFAKLNDEIRLIETMRGSQRAIGTQLWATEEERVRIPTILGSGVKQVLPAELTVMAKLRRVTDF